MGTWAPSGPACSVAVGEDVRTEFPYWSTSSYCSVTVLTAPEGWEPPGPVCSSRTLLCRPVGTGLAEAGAGLGFPEHLVASCVPALSQTSFS